MPDALVVGDAVAELVQPLDRVLHRVQGTVRGARKDAWQVGPETGPVLAGQPDLRPDSPAYAAQLRLISPRIVATASDSVGTDAVRGIRVLAVGAAPRAARPAPQTPAVPGATEVSVKTREVAARGYHEALACAWVVNDRAVWGMTTDYGGNEFAVGTWSRHDSLRARGRGPSRANEVHAH